MHGIRSAAIALAIGLTLASLASATHAAECGGNTRCGCNDIVTQDTVLGYDLGPCTTSGLRVASNVTLDCAGHAIVGNDQSNAKFGVHLDEVTGAEVRNCVVSGFRRGLRIYGGGGNVLFKNKTFRKVGDETFGNKYGIDLAGGTTGNVLKRNVIRYSRDEGVHIGEAHDNRLVGNRFSYNKRENLYLLNSNRNLVARNILHHGSASAIFIKHSKDNVFTRNEVRDTAIQLRGDSTGNTFEDNYLKGEGYLLEAYQDDRGWTYPHDNTMTRDCIRKTDTCYRFYGAYDNVATETRTDDRCKTPPGALITAEARGGQEATGNDVELLEQGCNSRPW